MALFIIHTSILTSGDHLIVIHPNYSSNLEVPKTIGCEITQIHLLFEDQWRLDFTALESAITPDAPSLRARTAYCSCECILKISTFVNGHFDFTD